MTRVAEYKQTGVRREQRIVRHDPVYDEEGKIISEAYDEETTVEVPIMGLVYRDMTAKEEAEFQKRQEQDVPAELTAEERLTMMEDAFAELCEEVFGNG